MFRDIFLATFIPLIIQLLLLPNVAGIDPNISDQPIPPDLAQINVNSSDASPKPIPTLVPMNNDGETSEDEPSGNEGNLEIAVNVGIKAEDQPMTAHNSPLIRMLGMDQKLERSIETEVKENQRQVMDDGTIDSSTENGEKMKKHVPLKNEEDADQNVNEKENKGKSFVAYDWTDAKGKELTQAEAEKKALIVPKNEAYKIIYQPKVAGATIPIRLRFEDENECSISDGNLQNVIYFQLKICEKPKDGKPPNEGKKCDKSVFLCYPGKMDPVNNNETSDSFALPNVEKHNEIVKKCKEQLEKDEEWKKQWAGKEMHAIKIHQNADGNYEVTASFSEEPLLLVPFKKYNEGDKNCAILHIGTEQSLFGIYEDSEHHPDEKTAVDQQKKIVEGLMNGFSMKDFNGEGMVDDKHPLKEINFLEILPTDLLPRSHDEHVMAFVAPEQCDLIIEISGEHLRKCQSQGCQKDVAETPSEIEEGIYKTDYSPENLNPITHIDQLPPFYKPFVQISRRDKQNVARIATTGETEIIFALATKDSKPPDFIAFRPDNADKCTVKNEPNANEFVLAFNGRPDCYGRFAWGPRAFIFKDEMDETNHVMTTKDMPLTFEGDNEDEIWTMDQNEEKQMMGTATCSIEPTKISPKKRRPGMEANGYLWEFILNPKKGENTPHADPSRCKIGLQFNLDDYIFLLSYEQQKPDKEKKPDDE